MSQLPVPLRAPAPARRTELSLERLADCVRLLDPGTRALLDLSVRRRVRDDAMAPVLGTDPFHLAWRRARALEALARDAGAEALPLGEVRAALERLDDEVWLLGAAVPALPAGGEEADASVELVEAEPVDLEPAAVARPGVVARLDHFAAESPTLRAAVAGLGRALARKAVRAVIWRRPR